MSIFCWGYDCAALRDAVWCLLYNSGMNEWCNRAGGKHHHFVRTGKRGLESWEVCVNIHQVPSTPFQLLLKRCLNKFAVRHCCSDIRAQLQTVHLLTCIQVCVTTCKNWTENQEEWSRLSEVKDGIFLFSHWKPQNLTVMGGWVELLKSSTCRNTNNSNNLLKYN